MNYLVQKQKIQVNQVKPFLFNQLVLISPLQSKQQFKAVPTFNFANHFKGIYAQGKWSLCQ